MFKRLTFVLLALTLALSLTLAACAPAPTPTEAPAARPHSRPRRRPSRRQKRRATEAPTAAPPTPTPPPPPVCDKLADAPAAPAAGQLGAADNPIVITFVPSGDTGKIAKAGGAIADCLSQMTGLAFKEEVGTSFAASIEAMGAEKAQVGFLNTFSALLAGSRSTASSLRCWPSASTAPTTVDPDKALTGPAGTVLQGPIHRQRRLGHQELCRPEGQDLLLRRPELDLRVYHPAHRAQGQRH